jgi:glycine dehydrogenase
MLQIRKEVDEIVAGKQPRDNNVIKNAPHPIALLTLSEQDWNKPYSKELAAYPLPNLRKSKFWPTVTRVDDGTFSSRLCLAMLC